MRYIILVYLLLVTTISFSQSKWSVGVMASPNLSFNLQTVLGERSNYSSIPKFSYEVGINVFRKLNKNFYFQTGLEIVNRKFEETHYHTGYYYEGSFIGYFDVDYKTNNVDLLLPLLLNYRVRLSDQLSITSLAGVSLGWHMVYRRSIRSIYVNSNNSNVNTQGIDVINLNLGLGCLYDINDKLSLMITPNFTTELKTSDNLLSSVSLRTTLIYKLK